MEKSAAPLEETEQNWKAHRCYAVDDYHEEKDRKEVEGFGIRKIRIEGGAVFWIKFTAAFRTAVHAQVFERILAAEAALREWHAVIVSGPLSLRPLRLCDEFPSPVYNLPIMKKSASIFRGAYTALVTPFTADGSALDLARLSEHIHFQADGGITGVVPCGTTGESPTLTDEEHRTVVETTIDIAHAAGLNVIAGAGSNNTAHAIELHRFAHAAGADGSLQVNPYYNKPSQEGLYRHFMAIADSCDLPICLYNIPGRSAVAILPDTLERLAKHPNIKAVKEATGSLDSASEVVARTKLALMSGDDSLTLPMAAVGGVGVVSVVSNIVPDRIAALCAAFNHSEGGAGAGGGDWEEARRIHLELLPLSRGLLSLDTNPMPVKAAMELLGRDTGALRLPMCRVSKTVMETIEKLLAAQHLKRSTVSA